MKYHKITPVNPSSAKNLIAKDFIKETWWTTSFGGSNSAQLKLWDLLQGKSLALPQVKTQHGVQNAAQRINSTS